jgi:hypothetical protein
MYNFSVPVDIQTLQDLNCTDCIGTGNTSFSESLIPYIAVAMEMSVTCGVSSDESTPIFG